MMVILRGDISDNDSHWSKTHARIQCQPGDFSSTQISDNYYASYSAF